MVHLNSSWLGTGLLGAVALPFWLNAHPSSAVGVDYGNLRKLLQSQAWEAAADETTRLVFQVSDRNQRATIGQDLLTAEAIDRFPCQDLKTLDQLWRQASQDRFGLQTQLQLADRNQVSTDYTTLQQDPDRWVQFRKAVGWQAWRDRVEANRQRDEEPAKLSKSTDVVTGTFPLPVRSTSDFGDSALVGDRATFFGSSFLNRARKCLGRSEQ